MEEWKFRQTKDVEPNKQGEYKTGSIYRWILENLVAAWKLTVILPTEIVLPPIR